VAPAQRLRLALHPTANLSGIDTATLPALDELSAFLRWRSLLAGRFQRSFNAAFLS